MLSAALAILSRADSFYNSVTGAGSTQDRSAYGSYIVAPDVSDYELAALWKSSGVARKISSVFPEDVMRQGVKIGGVDEATGKVIAKRCSELKIFQKFREAMIWGRHYGGGLLVLGADDGGSSMDALRLDAIKSFAFVDTYDKRSVFRESFYADPRHPKFGKVAVYRINLVGGGTRYVHESRCIRFGGALTAKEDQEARNGWDHSVLQPCYKNILRFDAVCYSAENLVNDASIGVLKMKGLIKAATGLGKTELGQRMRAMDLARSVARTVVVDAEGDESYTRTAVAFTGLPDMMDFFAKLISLDSEIPVPILFGEAPAGLNATGEMPVRMYYDRVRTDQPTYTPDVERMLLVVARSLGIAATPTCEWPSLWQLTPAEQDAHLAAEAARDVAYVTAGVLLPEEVTKMRFAGNPAVDLELRDEPAALPGGEAPQLPEGDAAPEERKTNESVEAFAADMSAHGYAACPHGRSNRCEWCGVERTRAVDGAGGFKFGWRAIRA